MLRLLLKPNPANSAPPAGARDAAGTVVRVRAGSCGYRLEAASRRAGLGSAFGRDRGRQRAVAAPR